MKKEILVSGVAVLIVLFFVIGVNAEDLIWNDIGRGNTDFRTVLISPDNPRNIYAGTGNSIIKTEDGAESWRIILSIKGQNKSVNLLLFGPKDKNSIYAATGNGLFYSSNEGKTWSKIFQGKNYLENDCTILAVLPQSIYLGTKAGLFVSKDKGRSWQRCSGGVGNSHIKAVAYNLKEPAYIYVACLGGIFRTKDGGQSWMRIFVAGPREGGNDIEEENEDQDEEAHFSNIRYISCDPNNLNYLYAATSKGVYMSLDRGESWELFSGYGLLSRDVRFLLVSGISNLYAATESGIFAYENDRWQELSLRLVAEEIRFLNLDKQNNLYAACDKGLFRASIENFNNEKPDNIVALYYKDEPVINEVQRVAINYAEVQPDKIRQWRSQAVKKAWLPQVSMGLDRNITDLWHWESGSTAIGQSGDDLLRRGRDSVEWDVSLAWDLSKLIFNDDQTSIDVRSRLMVELRDDILDEVTKLYFERLRVKMELDNLSIEDRKKRFEKELRLQELTASLDALTGGYFSHQVENNKVRKSQK